MPAPIPGPVWDAMKAMYSVPTERVAKPTMTYADLQRKVEAQHHQAYVRHMQAMRRH